MTWLFGRRKTERDEYVTVLEQQARVGEKALLDKLNELDSRTRLLQSLNHMDEVSAEALKELGAPNRA